MFPHGSLNLNLKSSTSKLHTPALLQIELGSVCNLRGPLILISLCTNCKTLSHNVLVPNTAGLHEVVQIKSSIVGVDIFARCDRMCVLHAVGVHPDPEWLHVGADSAVRCARDSVVSGCVKAVETRAAIPGQKYLEYLPYCCCC